MCNDLRHRGGGIWYGLAILKQMFSVDGNVLRSHHLQH